MKKHHAILVQLFKVLDSFKPQKPEFYAYLEDVIEPKFYPDDKILYEQDQVIKDVYFLASGTTVTYNFTNEGEKQILSIYQQNDLIAGQSFTYQIPSPYYLMVCAGAYMLRLTYTQLQESYKKFPDAQELARLILSAREAKEIRHQQMLSLPGSQLVETFFKQYPELVEPGKVLRDKDIASYLLLADSTMRILRNELFRNGKLVNPGKKD